MSDNLEGLVVSLITPMNDDYSIDFFGLKTLVARLMNKGVKNFFILGDMSEYKNIDYSYQKKIIVSVSKEITKNVNLVTGCFSDSVEEIIEKVQFAEKYSDFCVVNVPFNALTSEIDFIDFFDKLFTCTKSKIILFNDPVEFKRNIPINGLDKIAGWEKLCGVVDYSKNMVYFRNLANYYQLLKIFQGSESLVIESMKLNCSGFFSGLSNVFPELFVNLKKNFYDFGYSSMVRDEIMLVRLLEKINPEKEIPIYKKILFLEGITQEHSIAYPKEITKKELEKIEDLMKKIDGYQTN